MSLQKMLDAQAELQKVMPPHTYRFGYPIYDDDTNEEVIGFIKEMKLALDDEIHEMINEIGWKPWATSKHINRDAAVSEMVDAWHFFMNILLALDVDEAEFTRLYYAKHDKNAKRQQEGYDGVSTKCPQCKRAYDDEFVKCQVGNLTNMNYCDQTKNWYNPDGTLAV